MKSKLLLAASCALLFALPARPAVTITIQILDGPGVGFHDATPAAAVGGNPGTTLGQQRLNAFQAAANIWGSNLTSPVPIVIGAIWAALPCDATSAVLGAAGATDIERDFPGAPKAETWYPIALANKFFGSDLTPGHFHIFAFFNIALGQANCVPGTFFYLGLDGKHGANVDLVTVLLHEFGHGLGFQTFTDGTDGGMVDDGTGPKPSIWDWYLMDNSTGKTWVQMSNAERATSAVSANHLVWSGPAVTGFTAQVLSPGTPRLKVTSPGGVAGDYAVGTASFGPTPSSPGLTGEVMPVVDQPNGTGLACNPLSPANAAAVNGRIALVDRGSCTFPTKVKNCQGAGAIGVIVVDNAPGSPPPGLGGADPTVVIPAVRITLSDGNQLKQALVTRSRLHSGMFANIGVTLGQRAGADPSHRALMYAPNPYQGGSSVSHYDASAFPNQLMEPAINSDLAHVVAPPRDLTLPLLHDIGW
jgi:hypothetical protein